MRAGLSFQGASRVLNPGKPLSFRLTARVPIRGTFYSGFLYRFQSRRRWRSRMARLLDLSRPCARRSRV